MKKSFKPLLCPGFISILFTLIFSGLLAFMPSHSGMNALGVGQAISAPADVNAGDDENVAGDEGDIVVADGNELPAGVGEVSALAKEAAPLRLSSGFDGFNAQYQNQWKASFSEKSGKVKLLYGASSRRYENGPETVARGFLKDSRTLFGIKEDLSDLKTERVDETPARNHVRLQQTSKGIPIIGAQILVHSNREGQVTMVQNDYLQELQVANEETLPEEAARKIARDDLQTTLGTGAILSDAKSEKLIAPYKGKYYYVWKITVPTRDPWGLWVYQVDAASGEILYKANEILSLRSGKGRAYKDNAQWHLGKISNVPLKNMFTSAEGYGDGYLWGLHADIWDYYENDPYAPDYKFLYDPVTQKDWFDAVQTYYQLNTVWDWWNKTVLGKYGPADPDYFYWLPIPTIVNVADYCNAFYTSDLGWGSPGFVFGNEGSCNPFAEDLVIDNDVVRHEYTHAMMDWCGFEGQFGGPVHYYGRAMGEGNGDWFGYLYSKDPESADVAWNWSGAGYLRNLDNTRMYPRDVNYPSWGTPEEHYTGEIWGGLLYDLYQNLKAKALPYVYQSFFYFGPSGGHMSSYPDFFDAIWAQFVAETDLTGKYSNSAKAWGSWASRGINAYFRAPYHHGSNYFYTLSPGSDNVSYFFWNFPPVKSISTKGNLLISGDTHEYPIKTTTAGLDITVSVTGSTGGLINPLIKLYTSGGAMLSSSSSITNKAKFTYTGLGSGLYVITVTGTATDLARGYYSLKVSLK